MAASKQGLRTAAAWLHLNSLQFRYKLMDVYFMASEQPLNLHLAFLELVEYC